MSFKFEKFPGVGRGFGARASVRKNGQIGFNNGAIMHYSLADYGCALLYYDSTQRVIGVQPLITTEDPAACRLVHRKGNSYIAAKSFLDYFQIDVGPETRKYELKRDDQSGMLMIDLGKPMTRKGGAPRLDREP